MTWLIFVLLSALSTSFSAIFDKIAIRNTDSTLTATIYMVISAIFLIGFSVLFKKGSHHQIQQIGIKSVPLILLSGTIYGLSWLFYLHALKYGSVTKVAITDILSLLFTTLLSAFLLGECLQLRQIIGAIFVTIGAYLVAVAI